VPSRPLARRNSDLLRFIPNILTSLRLLSAPLLAWFIVSGRLYAAILVILFAAFTDWLDGYSARRLGVTGKTGIIFDPVADKVMLVALFCALTFSRFMPVWFLALALGRDLVIVVGALLVRILRNVTTFPPKTLGKVSTFFQMVYALLTLLWAAFPVRPLLWLDLTALLLAALFTVLSGIDYVLVGIRFASQPSRTGVSSAN
jgi:cardiolipin synthase